jgi:hypothetical protein
LVKDHDEQEELEKLIAKKTKALGNTGKNAHNPKSSSPSKKGKKKKKASCKKG